MHQGMAGNFFPEDLITLLIGRLAVQHNVRHLQELTLPGQLVNRVATVQQDAIFRIDIGNRRLTPGGIAEARIKTAHS